MRILIIGDVHNKPWIFDEADEILESGIADRAIQMGDLVDDWGQQFNLKAYGNTLKRAIKFHKAHPDTLWCLGNHDAGYREPKYGARESGHSKFMEPVVEKHFKEMDRIGASQRTLYIIDDIIFSHAGISKSWAARHPDLEEFAANALIDDEMWSEDGPLWVRPQWGEVEMLPAKLQVVGHTPVRCIDEYDGVLSTDTFSTYQNGEPYGDQSFAILDTETGEWGVIKTERSQL